MTDAEDITLETELVPEDAEREIVKAASARHSIARKYVMRARRRNPDATPAEIIQVLERQYATAITTAGALISAAAIAMDVGIAMIPVAGAATAGMKSAGQQAAKRTGKEAAKIATKNIGLMAAKGGAQRVSGFLPAGDEQLQFEITAVFALGLADIHGMKLDQSQAQALIYGLSNERVSQKKIAAMATDVATVSSGGAVELGRKVAADNGDWSGWANTLADALPGGAAQSLIRTIQTGQLNVVQNDLDLSTKQQAAVEYGVGALVGGVTRFMFGREVVAASRIAFTEAPAVFPEHLAVPLKSSADADEEDVEQNRALAALEEAAKATGTWVAGAASSAGRGVATGAAAVGSGVAGTASKVSSPFRSVDLDGDGIPDEARARTAVKGLGTAISGVAGTASQPFRSVDLDGDGIADEARAVTAVKGAGASVAGTAGKWGGSVAKALRPKKGDRSTASDEAVGESVDDE